MSELSFSVLADQGSPDATFVPEGSADESSESSVSLSEVISTIRMTLSPSSLQSYPAKAPVTGSEALEGNASGVELSGTPDQLSMVPPNGSLMAVKTSGGGDHGQVATGVNSFKELQPPSPTKETSSDSA